MDGIPRTQEGCLSLVERVHAAGWTVDVQKDEPLPGMSYLHADSESLDLHVRTIIVNTAELVKALESLASGTYELDW